MSNRLLTGYIFAGLAATSYAIATILIRAVVGHQATQWVSAVVSLSVGTVIIGGLDARTFDATVFSKGRALWMLVLAGILSGVAVLLAFTAYSQAPIAVIAPFVNLQPILTALVAHVLLGGVERITPRLAIALLLATAGAALIVTAV